MTTVAELQEILKDLPKDMEIMVSGYEWGVQEVCSVSIETVYLNVNTAWWEGKHELKSSMTEEGDFEELDILYIQ